jgi:cellulose synthase/poly-beta-1,6-N-acetylglucosamine synthase-like glycosyltransferase
MIVLLFAIGLVYVLYALWLLSMLVQWLRPDSAPEPCQDGNHLTIVIPFRNEAEHLPVLLNTLGNQKKEAPGVRIILVDDHSTDNSLFIAQQFKDEHEEVTVISQVETHGKKQGVDIALSQVKTNWVVTLDADIQPCDGWLNRIASWTINNTHDLLILPLRIGPGKNLIGHLQEVEFASVMAITGGMALSGRPILCNGGNLCFRKEAYERVRNSRKDMHITSGDDVFLLNALKPFGKVAWVHDPHVRVSTAPKSSWKEFTAQRLRWMGKAGFIRDKWLQATAWLAFLANGIFLITAIASLLGNFNPIFFLLLAAIKIMLDGLLILRVGKWLCIKQLKRFYLVLIFIYPIYATLFPLMSQFVKPSWKGRTTNNR